MNTYYVVVGISLYWKYYIYHIPTQYLKKYCHEKKSMIRCLFYFVTEL